MSLKKLILTVSALFVFVLETVRRQVAEFGSGRVSAHDIIAFLTEWLVTHIQKSDKVLARHLASATA